MNDPLILLLSMRSVTRPVKTFFLNEHPPRDHGATESSYGKKCLKGGKGTEKGLDVEEMVRITEQITDEVANAPVVKLVNSIIEHAIRIHASDIHIEPTEDKMRVLRLDGHSKGKS